ncbi:MAG: hypothetical protein ACTHU0_32630 [Kofleriaceae bacterium]
MRNRRVADLGLERVRHEAATAAYGNNGSKGAHAGALAAAAWLSARGLLAPPSARWEISIALDALDRAAATAFDPTSATRFHVAITSTEWGFYLCHGSHSSWIRVTDVPFVHERDDFRLLRHVPPLRDLGSLLQLIEDPLDVAFRRNHASIRSSIPGAEPTIRLWVAASL